MEQLVKFLFRVVFLLLLGFSFQSCHCEDFNSQLLVVERQGVRVERADTIPDFYEPGFFVDVPVNGPKELVDSVMALLNEELYNCCELIVESYDSDQEKQKLRYEEIKTNDAEHLVEHYTDRYKSLIEQEVFNAYWFSLILMAQTESFVTYGLQFHHCGGSCGSELMCYTFSKKDGHRLREVISLDDFQRFLYDHPDYKDNIERMRPYVPLHTVHDSRNYALLENSLLYVVNEYLNHYGTEKFTYAEALPYLSEEARQFVLESGDKEKFQWRDWYVGHRIGVVETDGDQTIYLMERVPEPEEIYGYFPDYEHRKVAEVISYVKHGGRYEPIDAFIQNHKHCSTIEFEWPNAAWTNPNQDDGYFAYDHETRELYVPFRTGDYDAIMHVYHFDGKHFVYEGKDVDTYSQKEKKDSVVCWSEDGKACMYTANAALLAKIERNGVEFIDTLLVSDEGTGIYPKQICTLVGEDGATLYLFIYSEGHLFFYDEVALYAVDKDEQRVQSRYFMIEMERHAKVGVMWWDQLVAASGGFPYEYEDFPDVDKYGIHYDGTTECLYVPVMAPHELGSEFANTSCLRYTGRFDVFQFNGYDFVYLSSYAISSP